MSTLTSASTNAEVEAAYDDNASYAEDNSSVKCQAFITACRFLLRRMFSRSATGGRANQELEFDVNLIQKQLEDAERWAAAYSAGSGGGNVVVTSFENFRD